MAVEFEGTRFGLQVSVRAAIFVAVMFGIPLVLYILDRSQGEDVTLTEAVRVTTATFVGSWVYFIFAMSMIRPCWRRMKELRLPRRDSLIIPGLMILDLPYFAVTRGDGAFGRSYSTIDGQIPFYLLTATGIVIAIKVAKTLSAGEDYSSRFGLVGKGAKLLAVFILAEVILLLGLAKWMQLATSSLGPEDAPSDLFTAVIKTAIWAWTLNPYICVVFLALAAWCVVISRRPNLSDGNNPWPTGTPCNT